MNYHDEAIRGILKCLQTQNWVNFCFMVFAIATVVGNYARTRWIKQIQQRISELEAKEKP